MELIHKFGLIPNTVNIFYMGAKPENTALENEIRVLLHHRLNDIGLLDAVVRIDNQRGEVANCLIELFDGALKDRSKVAIFEDALEEGFYFRAEKSLLAQIRSGSVNNINN